LLSRRGVADRPHAGGELRHAERTSFEGVEQIPAIRLSVVVGEGCRLVKAGRWGALVHEMVVGIRRLRLQSSKPPTRRWAPAGRGR
jgi:hypothetical protein